MLIKLLFKRPTINIADSTREMVEARIEYLQRNARKFRDLENEARRNAEDCEAAMYAMQAAQTDLALYAENMLVQLEYKP